MCFIACGDERENHAKRPTGIEAAWLTPDGDALAVDGEHRDVAIAQGWARGFEDAPRISQFAPVSTEDEAIAKYPDEYDKYDDALFDWGERLKRHLYEKNYVRMRAYKDGTHPEYTFQGKDENLSPPKIQAALEKLGLPDDARLVIEGTKNPAIYSGAAKGYIDRKFQ